MNQSLNNQRQLIERRILQDRRDSIRSFIRSIIEARSGIDRRADVQRLNDNKTVNSWLEKYHALRK